MISKLIGFVSVVLGIHNQAADEWHAKRQAAKAEESRRARAAGQVLK